MSSKSFYGLVGVCLHYNFSWSDNHFFFWLFSVGQIDFGRCILAPCGAHQCFELQYLKKKSWGRKNIATSTGSIRISTTAAKVVTDDILGKTPVSLPITTGYSLPPTWDRFRQRKGSRIGNDRAKLHELALDPIHSWSTAAGSCPPSDFSDRPPISISMTTGRKWLTWNRSIGRVTAMDPFQVCCLGEKWRLSVGRSRGRARQNHREAMEEGEQRLLSAKNCSEEEAKELRALLRTYLVTNLKV